MSQRIRRLKKFFGILIEILKIQRISSDVLRYTRGIVRKLNIEKKLAKKVYFNFRFLFFYSLKYQSLS